MQTWASLGSRRRPGLRRALGTGPRWQRSGRTAVVLVDPRVRTGLLDDCLALMRHDDVTLLGEPGELSHRARRHRTALSTCADDDLDWFVCRPPVDLVVDLRHPKVETRRSRWARLFLYVRDGGTWVAPRQAATGDLRSSEREWLAALARGTGTGPVPTSRALDEEAMRSVARLDVQAEVLTIDKGLAHVVKLRDEEMDHVLSRRDPQVRVRGVATLPAHVFHSRARITSHESAVPIRDLDTTIPVPRMASRHYRGPVAFAGQTLMYTQNSVLADSFRFYHALDEVRGNLANPNLYDFDARLSRVRPHKVATERLDGDYFQLDPQSTGHFGHIMTEFVARLWAWDAAKAQLPDLKVLMWARAVKPGKGALGDAARHGLEGQLLNAFGVSSDDIVRIDRPVTVTSLVSATAMWHNWSPFFVHPAIGTVWRRLAENLMDDGAPRYKRIFVTRPADHWRRRCKNTAEVEALFLAHGFTLVRPEQHTIGEQAAMFADAEVIAGFGGSGMFNMMFARRVHTIILLNQEGYTARNEHLFTTVLGCDVHYFWSTADKAQPERGWNLGAYQSEWTFDFARNERPLTELLVRCADAPDGSPAGTPTRSAPGTAAGSPTTRR